MKDPRIEVKELTENNGYWFIRTDGGTKFDSYVSHNVIGVGPNLISPTDIKKHGETIIKAKLLEYVKQKAFRQNKELDDTQLKTAVSREYNRIAKFMRLKKGDVILILSTNSRNLAFGIVKEDRLIEDVNLQQKVGYNKLKAIEWIKFKSVSELDSVYFKITKPQQAFTDVSPYQEFIDRVMYPVYQKKGFCHLTITVKKPDSIPTKNVLKLLDQLQFFVDDINTQFGYEEDTNDSFLKINVQSPGPIEQYLRKGQSIAGLAILLGIMSCTGVEELNVDEQLLNQYKDYAKSRDKEVKELKDSIDVLEVDLIELRQLLEQ